MNTMPSELLHMAARILIIYYYFCDLFIETFPRPNLEMSLGFLTKEGCVSWLSALYFLFIAPFYVLLTNLF